MINETLHTFISVTKNGSFNKAAEKLSLTAPAVMKQMNVCSVSLIILHILQVKNMY